MARRIHLSWDYADEERYVRHAVDLMWEAGVRPSRLTFYVLIGYCGGEYDDLYRVQTLREWGCDPFVMPFDRNDPYQRRFARWVNNKVAFKSMTWDEWQASFKRKVALP